MTEVMTGMVYNVCVSLLLPLPAVSSGKWVMLECSYFLLYDRDNVCCISV